MSEQCICDILYDLGGYEKENQTDKDYLKKRGEEIFKKKGKDEVECIHCGSTYGETNKTHSNCYYFTRDWDRPDCCDVILARRVKVGVCEHWKPKDVVGRDSQRQVVD